MEVTAVSVGKAVLDGALGYAKSKAAEEIALQLGVERDVDFITDELQMMQSFLEMADEGNGQNKVFMAWVKQIRDLAYKVEDSLMDFGLHSEKKPFWGCIPRSPCERRRIATEVKELRAKVEDVSNRNLRYRLVKDQKDSSACKSTVAEKQATIASAAMFAINEATLATPEQEKSEVDLHSLITSVEEDLRVIAMWGTSGDHGKMSAIQEVYSKVLKKFAFCAWVRLMYPFNPQEFLRNLVRQFYENSHDEVGKQESKISVGANISAKMEKMNQSDLTRVFNEQLCSNSYLIVINDLSTIEEWHCIQMYFPNNKKQSRIIVSTQNAEIASLCTEKPYQVLELKQLSCDQTIYLFHKKNTEEHSMSSASIAMSTTIEDVEEKLKVVHASSSVQAISDVNKVTATMKVTLMPTSEIQQEDEGPKNAGENKVCNSTAIEKFNRSRTLALVDGVITGRETEKSSVIKLVGQPDNNQDCKVISVWGMGGQGKTTLVRSVYRSQELAAWKHAWVTALRPFNPEVLLRDLALQLQKSIQEDAAGATSNREIALMNIQELKVELTRLLKTQNCLLVLDDILSTSEWDLVKGCLDNAGRIIVTTREKNIAKHCSREYKNMYSLEGLADDAALDLFMKKVFKDKTEKCEFVPAMMEQARIILKKCNGLPLAISTVGGFLATKPKTAIEWRRMNDRISAELEINPELMTIMTVLMRSYDGLPYYLKSAFLYLSIFQEDQIIRLNRLVRRWIAEGYSRDMNGITAEQLGQRYFDELLDRSMILPGEDVNDHNGKINSCQLHDIIREICILKAREENLVFTLEDGCCLSSTQGPIRHLVIGINWKRDGDALPSVLDLSHVRSLTVFGEWRPFFISENMRFLRVLDLEDTHGLRDHHLDRVWQLHHLKYLSLRECSNIFCLPNSLGNLRHLQTLDVRGTHIYELPTTITNLGKLQNLRAPGYLDRKRNVKGEDDILDEYLHHIPYYFTCESFRLLMFKGSLLLRPQVLAGDFNRRDVLSLCRFHTKGVDSKYGAKIPRGIGRLKALHTLSGASVTWDKGNATVKEFRELTELRKLGVIGISLINKMEFWSAIAGHYHLRSLSVRGHPMIERDYLTNGIPMWDDLDSCLGEGLSPPNWLESLKLYGRLVRITDWIHQLQNLSKLVLEFSYLEQDDAIQSLGVLPNLAVLRLKHKSFLGKQLIFQNSAFPSLVVLELYYLNGLESLLFEEDAMPKLELLQIDECSSVRIFNEFCSLKISGLSVLTSLKEIRLEAYAVDTSLQEQVLSQLEEHLNHVIVNFI